MNGSNCPACGQSMPRMPWLVFVPEYRLVIVRGEGKRLTMREAAIFGELYAHFGQTVHKDHLINAAYRGAKEPKDPYKSIQVMFVKIRRLLEGTGYVITNWYGESYALTFDAALVADWTPIGQSREAA